jgi:transcriptional regulator with XRE-family HTH domain
MCQTPELPVEGTFPHDCGDMGDERAEEFGDFLRGLRKARGLSQERLGELADVDNTTISKWERGRRLPERIDGIEALQRVAEILHDTDGRLAELAGVAPIKRPRRTRPPFRQLIVTEKETLKSDRQRQLLLAYYETLIDDSPES